MAKQEWYIRINAKQQGPFSVGELYNLPDLTPDSLVRKEGSEDWLSVKEVEELRQLFLDAEEDLESQEQSIALEGESELAGDSELTLDLPPNPYFLFIWFLLAVFVLLYILLKIGQW